MGNRLAPSTALTETEYPLSCQQLGEIARWSKIHYGGARRFNVDSGAFGARVAESVIEKLDPLKVLFLKSEVETFTHNSAAAWRDTLKRSNCAFFESWLSRSLPKVRTRLETMTATLPTQFEVGTQSKNQSLVADALPYFEEYASDDVQLKARLTSVAKVIFEYTNPLVLGAYHQDRTKFLVDSMKQFALIDEVPSRNLLAKAMLAAEDPYSTYFSPREFDDFYSELAGGSLGVGLKVRKVPDGMLIEKILKDSPAGRLKQLAEGDVIRAVDGKSLRSLGANDAKNLLRGKEGSSVILQCLKVNTSHVFSVRLKREVINYEDTRITKRITRYHGKNIAVIDIPSFYGRGGLAVDQDEHSSAEDLEKVVNELVNGNKKPVAIVLDLRGNPGGFLEEAVSMGGVFLGDSPVVGVVENKDRRVLRENRKAVYQGPLLVLVDKDSASASEVLAGALKDHRRAVIVGETNSFGKGTVQRLFHLSDELPLVQNSLDPWSGVVKLTTSIFYSPLGHSPANGGIRPDIFLPRHETPTRSFRSKNKFAAVPESRPFLDHAELNQLKRGEKPYESVMDRLRSDAPNLFREAERQNDMATTANVDVISADEDRVLADTVAVAVDYARLNQKN